MFGNVKTKLMIFIIFFSVNRIKCFYLLASLEDMSIISLYMGLCDLTESVKMVTILSELVFTQL